MIAVGAGSLHAARGHGLQQTGLCALCMTCSDLEAEQQKVGSNRRKTMIPKESDVISQDEQLEKGRGDAWER